MTAVVVEVSPAQILAALRGVPVALDLPGGLPADALAIGFPTCSGGTVRFLVESPSGALPAGLARHGVKVGV